MRSGMFCRSGSLAMDRGLVAAVTLTAILVTVPLSSAAPPGMQWFPGPPTTIYRSPLQQTVPSMPVPVISQVIPQTVPLITPSVASCVSVEPCIPKTVCSPCVKCKCKNKCKCKPPCPCNAEDERIEALEQFLERASDFYFTPILDEPIQKSSCCGCKRPKTYCCSEEDEDDRPSPRPRNPPGRSGRDPDRDRGRGGGGGRGGSDPGFGRGGGGSGSDPGFGRGGGGSDPGFGGGSGRDIQGDMPSGRPGPGRNRDRNQDWYRDDDMEGDYPQPRRSSCKPKDCGCNSKAKDCGCKPKKTSCCCLPDIQYDCYY